MSYFLTLSDIQNLCYEYAKTYFAKYEPIPPFEERFPEKLEIALGAPSKIVGGEMVYKSVFEQGAVLFYEMNKLHPFTNGNKRIAFVSLIFFLFLNGRFLEAESEILYELSIEVSNSTEDVRKALFAKLSKFIEQNSREFDLADLLLKNKVNNKKVR